MPDDTYGGLVKKPVVHRYCGASDIGGVWRDADYSVSRILDRAPLLRAALGQGRHPPLHRLAAELGAAAAQFDDANAFANVNEPGDLKLERLRAPGALVAGVR